MGRGQIGDSKSDKAYARMDKAMAKSDREKSRQDGDSVDRPVKENAIVAQLKELYPTTWEEELSALLRAWEAKSAVGDKDIEIKTADEYERV
jgi:hypothetical protein